MKPAIWFLLMLLAAGSAADAFAASVTLAWDGVPGLRYMVFYGTKSGVYTGSVDARDQHSIVIDGLADNQAYYFAVRAYDKAGHMSGLSKEVRKITTQAIPSDRTETVMSVAIPPYPNRKATGMPAVRPPADRKETNAPSLASPAERTEPAAPVKAPAPVDQKASTTPVDRKEPTKEEMSTSRTESAQNAAPQPVATKERSSPLNGVVSSETLPAATSNGSASATPASPPPAPRLPPPAVAPVLGPPGYLIGPSDVLSVTFWRDKEMNADVVVRPDGNITLPLLNDIQAAGLTPAQLRDLILAEAQRYIEDPSPTVAVKEIKSRNVFITGQVDKPGAYPLAGPVTVLQLIAMAGGLKEFADGENIVVMRSENGRQTAYQVNYKELLKRKNLRQNIDLKPGDTVVVP